MARSAAVNSCCSVQVGSPATGNWAPSCDARQMHASGISQTRTRENGLPDAIEYIEYKVARPSVPSQVNIIFRDENRRSGSSFYATPSLMEMTLASGARSAKSRMSANSAHWLSNGTRVSVSPNPPTIHDFSGFPEELFHVQYPAPGAPNLAVYTKSIITFTPVEEDNKWGLDHGAWSILKHMFPLADIPVFQLSIDYKKPQRWHFDLANDLKTLRDKN